MSVMQSSTLDHNAFSVLMRLAIWDGRKDNNKNIKFECTMDQTEVLTGSWRTLLHMRRTDAACALKRWQHFS